MIEALKLLSNTIPLSSNSTVFNAKLVRITNLANTTALITQTDPNSNSQLSTLYIVANDMAVIQKSSSDFLSSNNTANTCVAVKLGFSY
jgi:hypothetical protein